MLQKLKVTSYAFIYFLMFGFSFIALQANAQMVSPENHPEMPMSRQAPMEYNATPDRHGMHNAPPSLVPGMVRPMEHNINAGTMPQYGRLDSHGPGMAPPRMVDRNDGRGPTMADNQGPPNYTMACTSELPRRCIPIEENDIQMDKRANDKPRTYGR
jgi:hypothetical protein